MTSFIIKPVTTSADFEVCYALMQAIFPADELVDAAEYRLLLSRPHLLTSPHWFIMLACWTDAPDPHLIGLVAGSYMAIHEAVGQGMAMIEYLAVAEDVQHEGHGTALIQAFEAQMQAIAHQRRERLLWVVGEVDDDLLPFKFHLGYGLPDGLRYVQPPIEFDACGEPCYAPVPKHLVMKSMQGEAAIETSVLRAMIRTLYRWRYVPFFGDEASRQRAAAAIEQQVYRAVAASLEVERNLMLHFA